jgi:hypothetical protein
MRTRITRPTLAELWRVLLALLEGPGSDDAPSLARSLAIAGLIGRPAAARGVRVERRGEEIVISTFDPAPAPTPSPSRPPSGPKLPVRTPAPRRGRVLAAR